MSQIASFYLLKDGRRQELSNGDCSGAVYMEMCIRDSAYPGG